MNRVMVPSKAILLVGILYTVTGIGLLLAALLAIGPNLAVMLIVAGFVLLVAGVGLVGHRVWAWYLSLLIALSGLAVVGLRLIATGGAEWPVLSAPLVTNLLVLVLLLWRRPREMPA
jgi:hypothetical protein